RALRRAAEADPGDPEPWRLLLQLYRVEERAWEARRLGDEALAAVIPSSRREVLRDATLALLADLPDDQARAALDRWVAADPADVDARVARLRRSAAHPSADEPDRAARIAALADLLERTPAHTGARELLVESLADAGDPQRGRQVLDAWPPGSRDGRYDRLLGRWQLDYERDPAGAAASFERALGDFPYDWRTHYRLARACRALGRDDQARREAEIVGRLRETLDPAVLGPRLSADVARLDESSSCRDLADLCARAGLATLADAWRREAESSSTPLGSSEQKPPAALRHRPPE
ncbi:MAG: tetratricopeptide repeat protein, partial [Isosphaeraceae bacterium]|nr:tetratricopeptide repeat protein [Isosphaeraceae bacterium]